MKVFEPKEFMTADEVKERFYPLSVILVNCKVEGGWPVEGYAVAAETTEDDYDELKDLETALRKDSANGYVRLIRTSNPYEGAYIWGIFMLMKSILNSDIGRILFPCEASGMPQDIIFDTGAPNTMITYCWGLM